MQLMKTLSSLLLITVPFMIRAQHQTVDLFVGTYTNTGKSKGIYVYGFDIATGIATFKSAVASLNPSFLDVSTDRKYVYAVNENGDGQGAVSAYAYDAATGKLVFL